jgi:hypothetical protein
MRILDAESISNIHNPVYTKVVQEEIQHKTSHLSVVQCFNLISLMVARQHNTLPIKSCSNVWRKEGSK